MKWPYYDPEWWIRLIFQILGTAGLSLIAIGVFDLLNSNAFDTTTHLERTLVGCFFGIIILMGYLTIWGTEIHNLLFDLLN